MNPNAEPETMPPACLPAGWVNRIFQRLTNVYGREFADKYRRELGGVDVGTVEAMQTWAEELAGFANRPEAIAYVLNHALPEKAPNLIVFRNLCRQAPATVRQALPAPKLTPEEREHNRQRVQAMLDKLRAKFDVTEDA